MTSFLQVFDILMIEIRLILIDVAQIRLDLFKHVYENDFFVIFPIKISHYSKRLFTGNMNFFFKKKKEPIDPPRILY